MKQETIANTAVEMTKSATEGKSISRLTTSLSSLAAARLVASFGGKLSYSLHQEADATQLLSARWLHVS